MKSRLLHRPANVAIVVILLVLVVGSAAARNPSNPPESVSPPTISGTPTVGQLLTASTGTWTYIWRTKFRYQWSDCANGGTCTAIPGQTAKTLSLSPTDAGKRVVVTVTATSTTGWSATTSLPTAVVAPAPASTPTAD